MENNIAGTKKEFPKIAVLIVGLVAIICFLMVFILSQYTLTPINNPSSTGGKVCPQVMSLCPDGSSPQIGSNCEILCPANIGSGGGGTGGGGICPKDVVGCPDGSFVGRTGPNCEAVCPTGGGIVSGRTSCSSDADCDDTETCLDPSPVARVDNKASMVCWPNGKIRPICLAKGTLIDTPQGDRLVEDLRIGDTVWSQNAQGDKISVPVQRISQTKAPLDHKVVRLILQDGREVKASPHHPLADGREIGTIVATDTVDGSIVISAEQEAYQDAYTYDILPQSETGSYWANGVLLSSTLK